MTTTQIIKPQTVHVNLSSYGFAMHAKEFYRAHLAYARADGKPKFSPIAFFLCCRAIELALKAKHLESMGKEDIKRRFGHDLKKSYRSLPEGERTLNEDEEVLLVQASHVYKYKEFEYFRVTSAMHAFNHFPDIDALAELARKLTAFDE